MRDWSSYRVQSIVVYDFNTFYQTYDLIFKTLFYKLKFNFTFDILGRNSTIKKEN